MVAAALRVIGLPLLLFVTVEAAEAALRGRDLRPRALDAIVACWVVASALSAALGISPRLSMLGEIEQREGLLTVLALAGLYFGARRSHTEVAQVRGMLTFMLVCAALAAAYAMVQRTGFDPLAWENASSYPTAGGPVVRVFGTLGNPILLGSLLAAALSMGLARAFSPVPRGTWLIPMLVLIAAGIAATLSRGAMLAAAAGMAVAVVMSLRGWGRESLRRSAVALACVVGPAALWTWLALRAPLAARVAESLDARAESSPARIEIARSAIALWGERLWLGLGPDAFGLAFPAAQTANYWRNSWLGNPAHAHSVALQVLATGGAVTAAIGVAWLFALGLALIASEGAGTPSLAGQDRSERNAGASERLTILAGAAALVAAGAFNAIGLAGAVMFVALSAAAASLAAWQAERVQATTAAPGGTQPASRPNGSVAALRPSIVAIAASLILMSTLAARSSGEIRALAAAGRARGALVESTRATIEDQLMLTREAAHLAQRATALEPGEDELWRLRCDAALAHLTVMRSPRGIHAAALELGARPGSEALEAAARRLAATADSLSLDAESSARRALKLEPLRASNLQRLANALAMRGGAAQADSAFDAASARAPYDALILVDRVRTEMQRGRPDAALRSARRIIAMYPGEATGHALEAGAWMVMGRGIEARGALERALAARWEEGSEAQQAAAERALRALAAADSLH